MKLHEREYFISRIRSGTYIIKYEDLQLKVVTPTIEDEFEINEIFNSTYDQCLKDDIKTEDDMWEWMREREIWTEEDDNKVEGLKKDVDRLKVEIFNARNNEGLAKRIRLYIRAGEKQLGDMYSKKNQYQSNTCEGLATLEKSFALIKRCTFLGNEPYDFHAMDVETVWYNFFSMICSDVQIRELARNDPWKSLWVLNDTNSYKLFSNQDRELSIDQKNLLIWSRMYDNIQESMECPTEDVVNDDDMLDGWFIIQRKKRDKERAESELETNMSNSKISNADEIFMVAGSKKDADRIDLMNDLGGKITKQDRMNVIKQKGVADQIDFADERMKLTRQSNTQFKDKFRR